MTEKDGEFGWSDATKSTFDVAELSKWDEKGIEAAEREAAYEKELAELLERTAEEAAGGEFSITHLSTELAALARTHGAAGEEVRDSDRVEAEVRQLIVGHLQYKAGVPLDPPSGEAKWAHYEAYDRENRELYRAAAEAFGSNDLFSFEEHMHQLRELAKKYLPDDEQEGTVESEVELFIQSVVDRLRLRAGQAKSKAHMLRMRIREARTQEDDI